MLVLFYIYIYIYIYNTNIPPIIIIKRIYENKNLLSLACFLPGRAKDLSAPPVPYSCSAPQSYWTFATLTSETFWLLTGVVNGDMYRWLQVKLSVGGTCYFSKWSHIEHLRPCESLDIGWSLGSKLDFRMTVYLIVTHLAEKFWTYTYAEENLKCWEIACSVKKNLYMFSIGSHRPFIFTANL
jgi:hypothetical protein